MKIQHKITLASSALFGIVFLIVAVVIYLSFNNTSNHIFYGELARTAKIAGMFYLEKDELTKSQYKPIEEAFYNLSPDQKISIYDEEDNIAFDTEDQSEDMSPRLNEIRQKVTLNFKNGSNYYHGLFYEDNQGDFVVLVKAKSPLIQGQLENLILILGLSFLLGMIILVTLTFRLSNLAYRPVRGTIKQVNTLNLNQKPLSLQYRKTGDELEELFEAFNSLLQEIEQNYEQQKNFIDYASHELKTPLAGIINQLEVSLKRERDKKEYEESAQIVLHEAERMRGILKNLLTFSSLNRVAHQKETIRIDELVWDVIDELSDRYSTDKFQIDLKIPSERFQVLEFQGNQTLLHLAVQNIIGNAAKFSKDHPVAITLKSTDGYLVMRIKDEGIGINKKDLDKIAQPFYRAENATQFPGSGLGVSIALRVFELHHIHYAIKSKVGKGTTITLEFSG